MDGTEPQGSSVRRHSPPSVLDMVLIPLVDLAHLAALLGIRSWHPDDAGTMPPTCRVARCWSSEADLLQPEVEQLNIAEDLDALAAGGPPPVDDQQWAGQRAAHGDGGLLVRAAPDDGVAGEVDQPLHGRLRRGVGGVEVEGAAGAEQLALLWVDLEDLRQRAELHPLVEGIEGDLLADGELRAEGQGRVNAVDDRFVRGAAGQNTGVSPGIGVRTSASDPTARSVPASCAVPSASQTLSTTGSPSV